MISPVICGRVLPCRATVPAAISTRIGSRWPNRPIAAANGSGRCAPSSGCRLSARSRRSTPRSRRWKKWRNPGFRSFGCSKRARMCRGRRAASRTAWRSSKTSSARRPSRSSRRPMPMIWNSTAGRWRAIRRRAIRRGAAARRALVKLRTGTKRAPKKRARPGAANPPTPIRKRRGKRTRSPR